MISILGQASWECGFDGYWIDFPDMSNCSKIDITEAIDELNAEDSVPSFVIKKLNGNVSQEKDIGAGDIKNIIEVLDIAMKVQNDRLDNVEDPSNYAKEYTKESIEMLGGILERPESWFGIPTGKL